MRKIIYLVLLVLFPTLLFAQQNEQLIFAVDIIRHGARTSIDYLPSSPHRWPEGLGQLIGKGMRQEFELGKKLRTRYVENEKLLPKNYNSETIYIRSTDFDRTLMSAQSLLLGLYPLGSGPNNNSNALPNRFQPIPIHTVPKEQDTLMFGTKRGEEFRQKYVYTRADWKNKTKELQPYFSKWSTATGVPVNSLVSIFYLGDIIKVYDENNIPIPNLSKDDIQKLIDTGEWVSVVFIKPYEIGHEISKELLTRIDKYLNDATHQQNKLKYVLFSGHDGTVKGLFSILRMPLENDPPYAADLNFSLYKTSHNQYIVKMRYNDQPVNIPECGFNCPLEKFDKIVEHS